MIYKYGVMVALNGNTNLMKEINLNMLRKVMKLQKKATKPQLAELTGLSVVTVNSLIKVLLEGGELFEDEAAPSNGGRPAVTYRFNSEYSLALIIYMHEMNGNDVAFISVDNLWGERIEKKEKILNRLSLTDFDEIIEKFIIKYPSIKVISFGMPGVELQGKLNIIDYEKLQGKGFSEYFKNKFNLPVLFENDLNAAVIGYCHSNEIKDDVCVVALYYPSKYPPGSGIFLNGNIYKGRDGFAGEVGYLPIGVDWRNLKDTSFEQCDVIAKIILSITSLYNPHQVVLYGEDLPESIFKEIMKICQGHIPHHVLPEIIISQKFNIDFAQGIQRISLNFLEPTLCIKG